MDSRIPSSSSTSRMDLREGGRLRDGRFMSVKLSNSWTRTGGDSPRYAEVLRGRRDDELRRCLLRACQCLVDQLALAYSTDTTPRLTSSASQSSLPKVE